MSNKDFREALSEIVNDGERMPAEEIVANRKRKNRRIAGISAAVGSAFVIVAVVIVTVLLFGGSPAGPLDPGGENLPDPGKTVFNGGEYSGSAANLPPELAKVKITVEGSSRGSMPVDGSFIVETSGETDAETLAEYLTVTPAIATSVTKLSSNTFKVSPASGNLVAGQIYKLTLGDPENPAASYAFQTEKGLVPEQMFPGDRTVNVPVNTGIEVSFSETVDIGGEKDPFTITPAVKGRFSVYPDGKTVLFLPDSNLDYDTVYTVTVSSGIKSRSGKVFEGEKKAVFRTSTKEYESDPHYNSQEYVRISMYTDRDLIFSPGQAAYVSFYAYANTGKTVKMTCDLFSFESAKQAAAAIIECEKRAGDSQNADIDVSKLNKIGSFTPEIDNDSNMLYTVNFGGGLAKGIYLAKITSEATGKNGKTVSSTKSVVLQISELRPYTVSSDGKTYVWINSTGSGPVKDAELAFAGLNIFTGWDSEVSAETKTAKTDGSGLAMIESKDCDYAVITVEKGGDALVLCAVIEPEDTYDYYMSYVFTDREVYFADDTVNFSGFVTDSFGCGIPDRLYLRTGLSSEKTPVDVDKNGFFQGSLAYSNCSTGYFLLAFCDEDGNVVTGRSFRITEEQKPQYTASVSFDKLFYRRGEKINVTVTATFFDGTPAEGLEFRCRLSNFGEDSVTVKTNAKGEAKVTFKPRNLTPREVSGTDPLTLCFYAELENYETQTLYVSSSVRYFHSDYAIGVERSENASVMTLNKRDTSGINTAADLAWPAFPGNTTGEPLKAKDALSYTLVKHVITKTERTRYNTYTKQSEKYYTYDVTRSNVETGTKSFVNGIAEFALHKVTGFDGYYTYEVSFYDDTSKITYEYTLNGTAGDRNNSYAGENNGDGLSVQLNAESYSVNDTVEARAQMHSKTMDALFVTLANGIEGVSYGSSISFTYTNDMIARGEVAAVVFLPDTGEYTPAVVSLKYNTEAAALKPEISTSANVYRPGEKAVVNIKVPGVAGGFAVVSVVDEACFALGDQTLDPLHLFVSSSRSIKDNAYYDYYGYGNLGPHVSFNRRFTPAAAYSYQRTGSDEKYSVNDGGMPESTEAPGSTGDGGDSWYVRQYFADNPVYSVVELDENGCGTLTFTVPDNITSWRISALAYSGIGGKNGEIRIGASVSDVVCTQPFFLNIGICDQYILGDTISLSARAYGLSAEGTVNYTAVLSDLLGNEKGRAAGSTDSKERCWLKFELDEPGEYRVTVYGSCGNAKDALVAEFSLVKTAVSADVSRTVTVSELKNINPVSYPVRLVFANRTPANDFYERITAILSQNRGSGRTDEYAALYAAAAAREQLYGENTLETQESLMRLLKNNIYTVSGQFRLFPYSEPDARLTASVMSLGLPFESHIKQVISIGCLAAVSEREQESPEVLAANVATLAALGEPVLDTLYAIADTAGNYSPEAKLWLALGFALCGDYPAASDIYSGVKAELGVEDSDYGTLKFAADDFDSTVSLTCLALMNASRIARDDAAKLALWLSGNRSDNVSDRIALASYLKFFLPEKIDEPLEFTYSLGETVESVSLASGRSFTLTLSKSELDALTLSLPDDAKVGVSYRGTMEEALAGGHTEDEKITVTKTMANDSRGNCIVTLRIKGTSTRVSEYFELYDLIPSGARFFALDSKGYATYDSGTVRASAYIYNRNGQHMTGGVSVYNSIYRDEKDWRRVECPEYKFDISVSYVIRGAVEGRFIAESAYVRNVRTGLFSLSERTVVTIDEKNGFAFGK